LPRLISVEIDLDCVSVLRIIYTFYHKRLGWGSLRSILADKRNYYAFGQVILDKTATMGGFTPDSPIISMVKNI
jgi:hypothetical protein